MWFGVITLFPEMFAAIRDFGMTGRAVSQGKVSIRCWNPRDFTEDNYRRIDERPYGGGPGMVMMPEPLERAIAAARVEAEAAGFAPRVIYLSPQGRRLDEPAVVELAENAAFILLCGRYEGVDERLIRRCVDQEWSIGDYVLSGGELPAMVLMDTVIRRIPGVLGHSQSAEQDSFVQGVLDCPHYTRPEIYEGEAVPSVLLSGDHAAIQRWRWRESLKRTLLRRPELLDDAPLNKEQRRILAELRSEAAEPSVSPDKGL
ncbi:tRNA (guanine37-N(1)-) methyltransferase [Fluviicoccus keumensis]|uniref:tRNA (guanine-N(1)-)-methyltransferase n=1 Tax=Fluviicoccus keumensis TaxID=1435465 RepID=A0A4Q7ZBS6_9GAMM|nr:tRNA (guanosine(37)-N1)-methyltransferase TrmD [Fluviicoccus keumensis]RZU47581.1 tRNA (guanine37-N(1)-) methyltransferase [Fluviicoccus keumensis]